MKKANFLSKERRLYYKAKQAADRREREANRIIEEDARFVRFYGMQAFIELSPVVKGFSYGYHEKLVTELEKIHKRDLAQELTGISMAIAATKYKKSNRRFTKMIKDLRK